MLSKYFTFFGVFIFLSACADDDKSPTPGGSPANTPTAVAPSPVPLVPNPSALPGTPPPMAPTAIPVATLNPTETPLTTPSLEPSVVPTSTNLPSPSVTPAPTLTVSPNPTPSVAPFVLNGTWEWVDYQCAEGEFTSAGRVLALDMQKILKAQILSGSFDFDGKTAKDKETSDRGECVFSAPFVITSLGSNKWELTISKSDSNSPRLCGSKPALKKTLERRGDNLIELSAADIVKCTKGPFAAVYKRK